MEHHTVRDQNVREMMTDDTRSHHYSYAQHETTGMSLYTYRHILHLPKVHIHTLPHVWLTDDIY
jgi:hypothetical protein